MNPISDVPDWAALLLFIAVPAALAVGAHLLIRRFVPHTRLIPHHDVAGFLVAIVGVLYAVMLGFMVVTVWSSFSDVQQTSDNEAGDVSDLYAFTFQLPKEKRAGIQEAIGAYAVEVRDREFDSLRHGAQDQQARLYMIATLRAIDAVPVDEKASVAQALHSESIRNTLLGALRSVADNRRKRLTEAGDRLPSALYLALVLGGMMVMSFVFLFGVEDRMLQLTMTALVAGCIGLLLGLIVEFNAPYSGNIRVRPDAWETVIDAGRFRSLPKPVVTPLGPILPVPTATP